jgi:hypothetical protein
MASIFRRKDSPFIWIRYKDEGGKWKSKTTGYRANIGRNVREAKLLAREHTIEESARMPARASHADFREWVLQWIGQRWGHKNKTASIYRRRWRNIIAYLTEMKATHPVAVTRELALAYPQWRKAGRNTAIYELKFLALVMDEAIERKFIKTNCARKLKLKETENVHTPIWSDEQIEIAMQEIEKLDKYGWMHVTFLMGKFQAARLGQCSVPINCINLSRRVINYPGEIMKGGKSFEQSIDPNFIPVLKEIISHRRKLGSSTICDLPILPPVEIRKFLDSLGFYNISHHGLRVAWITRAALSGIPETFSRKFVNHSSSLVHQIYQRIEATDLEPYFERLRK